jgi:hypothetical protein
MKGILGEGFKSVEISNIPFSCDCVRTEMFWDNIMDRFYDVSGMCHEWDSEELWSLAYVLLVGIVLIW